MDDADITQERQEREAELLRRASAKPAGPAPTGHCLWCDEPTDDTRRWCDSECRDQWQRQENKA